MKPERQMTLKVIDLKSVRSMMDAKPLFFGATSSSFTSACPFCNSNGKIIVRAIQLWFLLSIVYFSKAKTDCDVVVDVILPVQRQIFVTVHRLFAGRPDDDRLICEIQQLLSIHLPLGRTCRIGTFRLNTNQFNGSQRVGRWPVFVQLDQLSLLKILECR